VTGIGGVKVRVDHYLRGLAIVSKSKRQGYASRYWRIHFHFDHLPHSALFTFARQLVLGPKGLVRLALG
jgi:hypothetical protein